MINPSQLGTFFRYVKSFYGPGQLYGYYFNETLTDFEIGVAIGVYLERLNHVSEFTWGDGDSVDRERVRDILLQQRGIKAGL